MSAPFAIEVAAGGAGLDEAIAGLENRPAVFLIHAREGRPYLARTNLLRRRLARLLGAGGRGSRLLNLREVAARVEYWFTASQLEASLLLYEHARKHFPEDYARILKLRSPYYVKLLFGNQYPRTQVTARLGGARNLYYGPFRTRGAAELFEGKFLELFQVRRCQEDLDPRPDHPGCVYGEMSMCLRPCQQVVTPEEYRSEALRAGEFLTSGGASLAERIGAARDRASAALEFEEAARHHRRLEKVEAVLKLRDELARDITQLEGVAVLPSVEPDAEDLRFLLGGCWQSRCAFPVGAAGGKALPMDQRLRALATERMACRTAAARDRQDHLALLVRWYYSSWRDGEYVPFPQPGAVPYRKLVNAIHRTARPVS